MDVDVDTAPAPTKPATPPTEPVPEADIQGGFSFKKNYLGLNFFIRASEGTYLVIRHMSK